MSLSLQPPHTHTHTVTLQDATLVSDPLLSRVMARPPLQLLAGIATAAAQLPELALCGLDLHLSSEYGYTPGTDPTHQAGVSFHTT